MDKSCSIVLPNQLFKESLFQKKNYKVFLVEEDLFFNQYKFHKQKICFHRATMKFYYDRKDPELCYSLLPLPQFGEDPAYIEVECKNLKQMMVIIQVMIYRYL